MADSILNSLPGLSSIATGDLLYVVDVNDLTQGANGTSKKLAISTLQSGLSIAASQLTSTTGSGNVVLATSPTLVTPVLGVATATSINKVAITAPASSATLTIANGATLSVSSGGTLVLAGGTLTLGTSKSISISNSLTLAGTDSTTITFQGTDTYVGRTTTDTLTNKTLTSPTINTPITNQGIIAVSAQAFDGTQKGSVFTRTLAGSETFTQSGFATGRAFIARVKQGSGTSYTVTWWSGITWITPGATAPVQTTTSNGFTSYGFICTGSNTFDGYLLGTN